MNASSMPPNRPLSKRAALSVRLVAGICLAGIAGPTVAQEQLPWGQTERPRVVQPGDYNGRGPSYQGPVGQGIGRGDYGVSSDTDRGVYAQNDEPRGGDYPYRTGPGERGPDPRGEGSTVYPESRRPDYRPAAPVAPSQPDRSYGDRGPDRPVDRGRPTDDDRYGDQGPGRAYEPAPAYPEEREPPRRIPYARGDQSESRTYSSSEIRDAGHRFFGRINEGLANVIEHAFKRGGRPNGFIIGEEGGGAFIAGLRYGEGTLHMKDGTRQKVYWQGPSIGYDFGAEGSKTMILVYDLEHAGAIYSHFGGVSGSAYLVGGIGLTFLKNEEVVLAPIRSGVGLRLGANLGYLKMTRGPTWNPF